MQLSVVFTLCLSLLLSGSPGTLGYRAPTCNGTSTDKPHIYIQGFVPVDNQLYSSQTIVPAATVACEEINSNLSQVLGDYELVIEWSDTMCDASEATWQLIKVVLEEDGDEPPPRIMFLGGGCSIATEPLAALAGRFYNVTQVSYGASTPTLSDRTMYPSFFRLIPSEIQSNSARFALMKYYNWVRVTVLHETRSIFSKTVDAFRDDYVKIFNETVEGNGVDDESPVIRSFTDDPEIPLNQIKDKDVRIILAFMYEDKALKTVCEALKKKLVTDSHLWMFPAWYRANWWYEDVLLDDGSNCTKEEMTEAVRYAFFLDSYNYGIENRPSDTGLTNTTFFVKYDKALAEFKTSELYEDDRGQSAHPYVTFTYDSVWTMALALTRTESDLRKEGLCLLNFTYANEFNITDKIFAHMNSTRFYGISGDVEFDHAGTRRGLNGIYQLVDAPELESGLKLVLLAVQDPVKDNPIKSDAVTINFTREPKWKGGQVPRDRRLPDSKYLDKSLIITCNFFISLALLVALALLVFNLSTMFMPLIRDSAPLINAIIIVGCVLMLITCYLLGIDTNFPKIDGFSEDSSAESADSADSTANERYAAVCNSRLWLFTIGFTLSFGALFGKTWQVYRVYTNPKLKKEMFKMWNFLIILGIFLAIDIVYLIIWSAVFPLERRTEKIDNNNADTLEVYEKCYCENFNYLIGALYVYKGLLVIFGLFLAYESRNVKYYYINDSRFVSISMYIVVIVVGIGAPLSLVLSEHRVIDVAYALSVITILVATMSSLLILFVPKFVYMAKGKETMVNENTREEVTASDGLQLGHTSAEPTDMQSTEEEMLQLKKKVAEKENDLKNLEESRDSEPSKTRCGSDGDSGVLVTTTDEQPEVFENGDINGGSRERRPSNTPPTTSSSSPTITTDEGL